MEDQTQQSDSNRPLIAVAGATGFVGRHVTRHLLDHGFRVRALVRNIRTVGDRLPRHETLELREVAGLTPAELGLTARRLDTYAARVQLDDGARKANPLEGCDAVVNTVGIIREASGGQTFNRVHVGVTDGLVEAARRAGCDRYIQISAIGVNPEGPSAYFKSKHEAEQIVQRSGLTWTILRPSLIHGPDAGFIGDAKNWVRGRSAPFVFVPYFTRETNPSELPLPNPLAGSESARVSPVHVEDVASAVHASLDDAETSEGEIYNLVGDETLTWPELLEHVRDHVPLARPLPVVGLPSKLGVLQAKGLKWLGMRDLLPFDEGMAMMAAIDSTASLVKARAHLGFDPRGFRESFAAYAESI
ncbi:MAG: NAD(P)H-binding protein [Planctomycetota bacterium]